MWPMEASTWYSLPKYLLIVFAFAGDSTITNDLLICSLHPPNPAVPKLSGFPFVSLRT
jgi:hypothetical protein